jgi:hypothetical protein
VPHAHALHPTARIHARYAAAYAAESSARLQTRMRRTSARPEGQGQLAHAQHGAAAAVRLTLDMSVPGVPSLAFRPASPSALSDDPMAAETSSTAQKQQPDPKRRRVGDMTSSSPGCGPSPGCAPSPTASPAHSFVVSVSADAAGACGNGAGASAPALALPVPRSYLWLHSLPGVTCSLAECESPLSRPKPPSAGAAGPSGTPNAAAPGAMAASRVAAAWHLLPAIRQLALMSGCAHALVSKPLFGALMDSPSADGAATSLGCFLVGTQAGAVWAYPLDQAGFGRTGGSGTRGQQVDGASRRGHGGGGRHPAAAVRL